MYSLSSLSTPREATEPPRTATVHSPTITECVGGRSHLVLYFHPLLLSHSYHPFLFSIPLSLFPIPRIQRRHLFTSSPFSFIPSFPSSSFFRILILVLILVPLSLFPIPRIQRRHLFTSSTFSFIPSFPSSSSFRILILRSYSPSLCLSFPFPVFSGAISSHLRPSHSFLHFHPLPPFASLFSVLILHPFVSLSHSPYSAAPSLHIFALLIYSFISILFLLRILILRSYSPFLVSLPHSPYSAAPSLHIFDLLIIPSFPSSSSFASLFSILILRPFVSLPHSPYSAAPSLHIFDLLIHSFISILFLLSHPYSPFLFSIPLSLFPIPRIQRRHLFTSPFSFILHFHPLPPFASLFSIPLSLFPIPRIQRRHLFTSSTFFIPSFPSSSSFRILILHSFVSLSHSPYSAAPSLHIFDLLIYSFISILFLLSHPYSPFLCLSSPFPVFSGAISSHPTPRRLVNNVVVVYVFAC
ncbi:hypothetical protein C7M84_013450 [Penaeus vannamei]|uniref:Uncharacterized protein n=1 Tax=Penaeus vannamei TaxID=6689 RepID=A0A3R7NW71_PENVA|nr:hypothetical protein C7M84_013450 [Penaeus vannamei]